MKQALLSFLALCLSSALVAGCASFPGRAVDPVMKRVAQVEGSDWYGAYLKGRKLGWARTWVERDEPGDVVVGIEVQGLLASEHGTVELAVDSRQIFSSSPPFGLVRAETRRKTGGAQQRIQIVRGANGYRAEIERDGLREYRALELSDYGLRDVVKQDLWLLEGPEDGAELDMRVFDGNALRLNETRVTVTAVRSTLLEGIPIRYTLLSSIDSEGDRVQSVADQYARLLGVELADGLRLQLEPRKVAQKLELRRQLLIGDIVPVDRPLGEGRRVSRLQIAARGPAALRFNDGPGQRVEDDPFGGQRVISVDPARESPLASAADREAALLLPADPQLAQRLGKLARKAVGRSNDARERTARLLDFVSEYIADDLRLDAVPLAVLLDDPRGDASEHAQLFVALARNLGIPARSVGGLFYLGDETRGFGRHTWAEVVLADRWVPVDPTWAQLPADATHLRYPMGFDRDVHVAVGGMLGLAVLAVEFDGPAPPLSSF